MKSLQPILWAVPLLGLAASAPAPQFYSRPSYFREGVTIEISLENPPKGLLRLPMHRNAVTSLAVVGDWAVGGTSAEKGLTPFVFAVSIRQRRLREVFDLKTILPDQRAVVSGFAPGSKGELYAGTLPDGKGAGHLIRVRIQKGKLTVEDLGTPVDGEGIFALASDPKRGVLYGIAHPSGKFFSYNLAAAKATVFPKTPPVAKTQHTVFALYQLKPEDYLSRRLVLDGKGRVYGSMPIGRLFRYDPETRKVTVLPDTMPEVWGRRPLSRADAWAVAPDGTLFCGNAGDGQVFTVNPDTGKVCNLGKPIMMNRIMGLAFSSGGRLYGIAGADPGYSHLFYYEPGGRGFVDLGCPCFQLAEIGGFWRAYQIASLAASEDGKTIVLGEDGALSQLMIFSVR